MDDCGITKFLFNAITDDEEGQTPADCDCALEGLPMRHGTGCPVKILAECDAKLRILALHQTQKLTPYRIAGGEMYQPPETDYCECQCPDGIVEDLEPCETKRIMALPYAEREGYSEEWKPRG